LTEDATRSTQDPEVEEQKGWLSARVEPFWVNPATIKGTIAIIFGLIILLWPETSVQLIRILLGVALALSGVSDLWFRRRKRAKGKATLGEGLVSIIAGIALVFFPRASFFTLLILVSAFLAVRGSIAIFTAVRDRSSVPPMPNLVRGAVQVVAAGVILLVPESLVAGVVVTLAVVAFILGAIMLAYGLQYRDEDDLVDIDASTVSQMIKDWVDTRDIGDAKRARIGEGLFFEDPERGHKLTSWWVMLLLSVAIATFAVLADSTAVVIGAMLVAPLMTPIMGIAAAIVHGWRGRMLSSLGLVAAGVGAAIVLAFILATWVPTLVPLATNSQVTSRISPTLIDMLIALAAGAAGAYATVDDRVSSSITGVAIAVALVPPLSVVGVTLEAGLVNDALGAFLLFLTNLVSIILAGSVVLYLTGFATFSRFVENRDEILTTIGTVAVAAMLIMVPLFFTAEGILSQSGRQALANTSVDQWVEEVDTLRVFGVKVDGAEVEVRLSGSGEVPDLSVLEDDLTEEFGVPVTVLVEYAPTVILKYSDTNGLIEVG